MDSAIDWKGMKEEIDRPDNMDYAHVAAKGLSEDVVRLISSQKNEPEWMLEKRLEALKIFNSIPMPTWGPSLDKLKIDEIIYYARPKAKETKKWEDVPAEIKNTFEKLGIPEAERKYLAGAGAQLESEMVYHKLKEEWEKKGVVFENMDVALQKYPDLVKKYFMTKCVPISDHKFAALHGAVWAGGTFLYVPAGVRVSFPLQAYFRMNSESMGQFEHTLIVIEEGAEAHYIEGCSAPQYASNSLHAGCVEVYVAKNARFRYSSVENWSKNTYNLNTKRAIVNENAVMEWVSGNMGSAVTMLYPSSVLIGWGARANHISIAYAGAGQNQDTGAKVFHMAPRTSSTVSSKSISKDGGITTFRSLVRIGKKALGSKTHVRCDALLLDEKSKSNTYPHMDIQNSKVHVGHEATVGKISPEQLFYLMSRGLNEQEAIGMIVNGFIEPVTKELPIEYAVELNRLIEMEMEGAIG